MPDKKIYLEFITAALTIPVLITVLLSNINSLNRSETKENTLAVQTTATPAAEPVRPTRSTAPLAQLEPTEAPVQEEAQSIPEARSCEAKVGTVDIPFPKENDKISTDPVCIDISRNEKDLCGVVWSYRINDGAWSNYTDKSICLYGLPPGQKTLDLRVRSIASADEIQLKRTFTVTGPSITPTTPPISTSSALPQSSS